jgi:hypothetical protein
MYFRKDANVLLFTLRLIVVINDLPDDNMSQYVYFVLPPSILDGFIKIDTWGSLLPWLMRVSTIKMSYIEATAQHAPPW